MPYVMVPVPEEHVTAVMEFILHAVEKAAVTNWDTEALTKVWDESDEATRSLLAFTARAAAAGQELDIGDAARQVQLTPRDITSIINELAALARDGGRPTLIGVRNTTVKLPNGRTTDKRLLVIDPEVADMVREVERAELLDAMPPEATQ